MSHTPVDVPTALANATQALDAGDPRKAFQLLRPVLHETPPDSPNFAAAFSLFARIANLLAGPELARHVTEATRRPHDPQSLYDLGYQLNHVGLHDIAIPVLARLHALVPRDPNVLSELVHSLESESRNAEAVSLLRSADLDDPILHYLLAFNLLMSADIPAARAAAARIRPAPDSPVAQMLPQLDEMLVRADALRGHLPLDTSDLRGWHLVTTGSVLLRLSPDGFDAGMNGRYAWVQDSESACRLGIERLRLLLDAAQLRPPCVFLLPDRYSAALATAAADLLRLPLAPWPDAGSDLPGLIPAYDLSTLPPSLLQSLHPHRPGQILWSHATCWTQEGPFAPDLTTYLYQYNVAPWDARLRFDPDTQQPVNDPPAEGAPADLAARITSVALSEDDERSLPDDLDSLLRLAPLLATIPSPATPGLLRSSSTRRRQRPDSPVKSNRFL